VAGAQPSRAQDRRRREQIVRHLEDLPRQYAALESAMAAFGEDFDLQEFKRAFDTLSDMEAYNRVQAVERGVGRVQNYIAELAETGAKLVQLPHPAMPADGSPAQRAFEALRDAGVIDASLCRALVRAQKARSAIEHSYVRVNAGEVHRAALLVHQATRDFIGPYRDWIAPYLEDEAGEQQPPAQGPA
jgi:uncharacterized protein YutE (UPF0331/DUF86 family)